MTIQRGSDVMPGPGDSAIHLDSAPTGEGTVVQNVSDSETGAKASRIGGRARNAFSKERLAIALGVMAGSALIFCLGYYWPKAERIAAQSALGSATTSDVRALLEPTPIVFANAHAPSVSLRTDRWPVKAASETPFESRPVTDAPPESPALSRNDLSPTKPAPRDFFASPVQAPPTVVARPPAVVWQVAMQAKNPAGSENQNPAPVRNQAVSPEQRIQQALEARSDLEFEEIPFSDVVASIADKYGLSIVIDKQAVDDLGFDTASPITVRLKGIKLQSAIDSILEPLDLDWIVRHEVLLITSLEAATSRYLESRVYDVTDILLRPGETFHQGLELDYQSLIDVITETLENESWSDHGGDGRIETIDGMIVVTHDRRMHAAIDKLLGHLREVRSKRSNTAPSRLRVVTYAIRNPRNENSLFRGYGMLDSVLFRGQSMNAQGPVAPPTPELVKLVQKLVDDDGSALPERLAVALPQLVGDEMWKGKGGEGTVLAVPGAIIVKHNDQVQGIVRQIVQPFMADPSPQNDSSGGMGGFGGMGLPSSMGLGGFQ